MAPLGRGYTGTAAPGEAGAGLGQPESKKPQARSPERQARSPLRSRLTAFVLKILSLAQDQVGDSPEKLQETAGWLLGQQLGDGSFHDPCPIIHRGMQVRTCQRRGEGGAARPGSSQP